jgi:hypothetical protein
MRLMANPIIFHINTNHLKKIILEWTQGISELIPPGFTIPMSRQAAQLSFKITGILEVVEDFQGGLTPNPG